MAWRVRKSIKISKNVRLNIGKKGASVSVGKRGARVTVGKNRVTRTVSIPGTGIYNTKTTTFGKKSNGVPPSQTRSKRVTPSASLNTKFYPKPSLNLYIFAGCFLIGGAVGFPYGGILWIVSAILIALGVHRDRYRKAWQAEQKDKNDVLK